MKEGDVIIVPVRQRDGMVKNRPAIILREMIRYRTESRSDRFLGSTDAFTFFSLVEHRMRNRSRFRN